MDVIRIGDVCEVLNGFAFKSENYVDTGIRVIRIANVQKGYIEDNTPAFYPIDSDGIDRFMLDEGDLLMSLTGNVGRVAILAKEFLPAALNQRVACLRLKSDKISKRYLFHILNSDFFEEQCIQSSKGVAQKNMSTEWLKEYEIPLYSHTEQKEIVDALDSILAIIEERKLQLRTLNDLIKARFVEMFGDPIRNTQNRPTTDFINVVMMQRGFDLPVQDRKQDGEIPVYGSNGALDRHNVAKVYGGGVITGRSGTIGKVYYTEGDYWPLNTSLFSVDTHGNNIIYLAYLLMMYDLSRFTEGTGVPTLNRNKFHNKPIINVPLDEQVGFADFVKQVDKSKAVVRAALDKAQLLFDSLMQQYFG